MFKIPIVYFLLFLSVFPYDAQSLCSNKTALYAVNATVHYNTRTVGERVSENFYLLENYTVIHVYQANVTDLCEGMVKNFPKLEILSLINVNLSRIQPDAFQNVENLKQLSLAVNFLTEISKGIFNTLPALEILYLSANQISDIEEDSFAGMKMLQVVHLDRNNIITINGNIFRGCSRLNTVDFRFNQIEYIGENAFDDLKPDNPDYITIFLSQNFINDIHPNAFDDVNPVKLHLEKNRLNAVSNLFHRVKDMSKIYLNKNQFYCIPEDVIVNMRNTSKDLYLLDNPLSCECMDRIAEILGEEIYGKGQLFYNSSFPCDSIKQFQPWN